MSTLTYNFQKRSFSSHYVLKNTIRKFAIVVLSLQTTSCATFSDTTKAIIANNEIAVSVPENKSSIYVYFQPPCISIACIPLQDASIDLNYNVANEVASNIEKIVKSNKQKSNNRYHLVFVRDSVIITKTLLTTFVNVGLHAELRNEAGQVVDKSVCTEHDRYAMGITDQWRDHPNELKEQLSILAQRCLGTFRKELGI